MEFKLSHSVQDNILLVTPQNERLDAKNASVFKDRVLDLIQKTKLFNLVLDLSHLQFIDSSGLGAFLAIQRLLNKQGGGLKLPISRKTFKQYLK